MLGDMSPAGRSGPLALPKPIAERIRSAQMKLLVQLREIERLPWEEIASRVLLSEPECRRKYRMALEESRGLRDAEEHRNRLFADIDLVLQQVRPWVTGEDKTPDSERLDPDDVSLFLSVWKAEVAFLGAMAPRETRTEQVVTITNSVAEEFAQRLARWARETEVMQVHPEEARQRVVSYMDMGEVEDTEGRQAELPPSMNGSPNGNGSSNGSSG